MKKLERRACLWTPSIDGTWELTYIDKNVHKVLDWRSWVC